MDKRELGRAYGFNDQYTYDEEAITSPLPTITRRSGKILRSPVPQPVESYSYEQPIESPIDIPDIDEDAYENEHITSTSIRKRPSVDIRISQHSRVSSPLLMDTLIAQNMQIM